MGFKVGKRPLNMPGNEKTKRAPGSALTDEDVKLFGGAVQRMLQRGDITSDTVQAGDLDMAVNMGSTIVDERLARERLDEAGINVDAVADRAMVYAVYDHAILGRDAKSVAEAHKVDHEAVAKIGKTKPKRPAA